MAFEHDFLISYAHIDDQALVAGESGWVSQLHRLLEIRVGQLMGQTPKIWRDPKLQGNDYFADTILERLPRIAAIVSVLSPRYVQSEWCNRELKEFSRAAQQSGGVRIADKARIFKVVKTPVQAEKLPEEVQAMLGYDFFIYDESGRPREMAQEYGAGGGRAFLTKLDDLAYDITQLLQLLQTNGGTVPTPAAIKGTVFLAETTFELRDEREAIKRDLIRNGYEVLPDRPLPMIAPELEPIVRDQLGRSTLSIHLIGKNYGVVPEGDVQSLPELQQALASKRGAAGGLASMIWIAPDLEADDERQRRFIERLQTDPEVHASAELLEIPLEDLKTLIYRKLLPPSRPEKVVSSSADELTRVYLICDRDDVDAAAAVTDYLFDQGYEVILPVFDEDEAQMLLDHDENLKSADAVLIFYGAANEVWLRRKLRELQRSDGLGREKPWLARAIYVAGPATPQKQRLRTLEATVLHQSEAGFDAAAIEPFLIEIAKAKGGKS
jgi:hypothetical protein